MSKEAAQTQSSPASPPAGKSSAINLIFVLFIAGGILFAGFTGRMQEVTDASFDSAKSAVNLAIGLIGIMALWLGLVRVLEAGGLMYSLAKLLKPVMTRLFPDVPATHPAMGAMILNISANMLGLGNAATPFGIKAMTELNKLNPFRGTATNAMCLFLAINTSSVALLPLGVIGVRAAANCTDPAAIWVPTTIATFASTIVGVLVAFFFARIDVSYRRAAAEAHSQEKDSQAETNNEREEDESRSGQEDYSHLLVQPQPATFRQYLLVIGGFLLIGGIALFSGSNEGPLWAYIPALFASENIFLWLPSTVFVLLCYFSIRQLMHRTATWCRSSMQELACIFMALLGGAFFHRCLGIYLASASQSTEPVWEFLKQEFVSHWLMPFLMLLILFYGLCRGVKIYEAVTEGAKQGFEIAVRIIPFLVAILVAIGMFRASGALQLLTELIDPLTSIIGMPAETLPMALIRPLSGSGAFGVMSELVQKAPDSYNAYLASTMMGSTETTFYVLAVYFGSVGIVRIRHALVAALLADLTGVIAACAAASYFYVAP